MESPFITVLRLGQTYSVNLPELEFEIGNDGLPLQVVVNGGTPVLEIEWEFNLAFGFDDETG